MFGNSQVALRLLHINDSSEVRCSSLKIMITKIIIIKRKRKQHWLCKVINREGGTLSFVSLVATVLCPCLVR